ncbi:MAG: relaxase MobL, partial [Pyrinomonadaceae bacterium]
MRIIASIQSKRGSSRGLVHYLSHSKIDPDNEPERGRELFNRFGDSLDVKSANNYLKADVSGSRPSNEELHHLVLSFRPEDFERLGTRDRNRRRSLKQITRAAMNRLERSVNADRLAWTAAVHLNTRNPHVHIAIQKQYFNVDLEKKILGKIPRDAIPHYRDQGGKKKDFSPGLLIEAAAERMDEIIDRNLGRDKGRRRTSRSVREKSGTTSPRERDAEILRKELLHKSALKACEKRIGALIDHGHRMRFMVFDSMTGRKRRLSLEELDRRAEIKEQNRQTGHDTDKAAGRRIRTILLKLTAREESKRQALEERFKAINRDANAIRSACRKQERKLPAPALTKEELDRLQKQCLDSDDIRTFGYLERVRSELSASRKIPDRDEQDLQELSALATIYDLRSKFYQNRFQRHSEHRYTRKVELNGTSLSLFELDKNLGHHSIPSTLSAKVRSAFGLQTSEVEAEVKTSELRSQVRNKLNEEDRKLSKRQSLEQNKAKLLRSALSESKVAVNLDYSNSVIPGAYLKDIESLSFRLKNVQHFERSWEMQRSLIQRASLTSLIGREIPKDRSATEAEQLLEDHKAKTIAGRAFAREIVSRIQLDETKSELRRYSKFRGLHKFEVVDPQT